jgi:hypothetical protein
MSLEQRWSELAKLLSTPTSATAAVDGGLRAVAAAIAAAGSAERRRVGAKMIEAMGSLPARAGSLAALCATLLHEREEGLAGLGDAAAARLPALLTAAARVTDATKPALHAQMTSDPDAVQAHLSIETWCMALIAPASRDRALRARLHRDEALRAALAPLSGERTNVTQLDRLVRAPCGETFRFVDTAAARAFDVAVDGVVLDYELYARLADALGAALGLAPEAGILRHARWDLHTVDGKMIWGEMRPDEVPALDGVRTVVASPLTIARTWEDRPVFPLVRGTVTLLRELPADEATALIRTIAARTVPRPP